MHFAHPLVPGRLICRYKRFLADVMLDGETVPVTAHCANPGAMLGLKDPGLKVWLEPVSDPRRKLRWSWRVSELPDGSLIGMDTSLPNRIIHDALQAGAIGELTGYDQIRPEVPYGVQSRVDFLLTDSQGSRPPCLVEVKNVHLMRRPGLAEFPDCVTARGAKHLAELERAVAGGQRAVLLYLIQREDCRHFAVADDLDRAYGIAYRSAQQGGVEMLAYAARFQRLANGSPAGIDIGAPLPLFCPGEPVC